MNSEKTRKAIEGLFVAHELVQKETIAGLGEEALKIADFYANSYLDISSWVHEEYREESRDSAVVFYLRLLFKEIQLASHPIFSFDRN